MKNCLFLLLSTVLIHLRAYAQFPITLTDSAYTDMTLPDTEPPYSYGFINPIYADVLSANPSTYVPSAGNRYFMSLFGPRYKQTPTSSIGFYDFHQGEDFSPNVTYNAVTYDTANKVTIVCMCDGIVTSLLDSTDAYLETIEQGRSVTVKCDSTYKGNPLWGHIYMNYRHLSVIDSTIKASGVNAVIHKGDTIGKIGKSGQTEAVHLHYSITRSTPQGMKNMHPMRVFNPTAARHIHQKLDTAVTMQLLGVWTDSVLIRVAIPLNEVCIKKMKITCGMSYTREFDFETIGNLSGRDTHTVVPGLALYAYPFNRYQSTYSRYKQLDSLMPVVYPAARFRPAAWGKFPIPNSWPFNKSQYVLDIMVSQLPAGFNYQHLVAELHDIYGTVVKGTVNLSALPATLLSFDGYASGREVTLKWETTSEVHTDYFVVERSDNQQDFTAIYQTAAMGNSNVRHTYSCTDRTNESGNYYRLRLADQDGKATYSKVICVKATNDQPSPLRVYPNPSAMQVSISPAPVAVNAIDAKGNRHQLDQVDGDTFDVSILPAGSYILECKTDVGNQYRLVVITR